MCARPLLRTAWLTTLLCLVLSPQLVGSPHAESASPLPTMRLAVVPAIGAPPIRRIRRIPAVGLPKRLVIPSLKIDAAVQDIGLLPGGKLDAPKNGEDVGWYTLGPRPGEQGNAVIDGHFTVPGAPGVFRYLHNIKAGDTFSVTDEYGQEHAFRVHDTATYHVKNAPMQRIFGQRPGTHLTLITCAGRWDKTLDHYDKRLVVYAEAIDTSEQVVMKVN